MRHAAQETKDVIKVRVYTSAAECHYFCLHIARLVPAFRDQRRLR